ncbi:MAG: hypothetical protein NTV88_02140 [Candidatus Micrarchaeota archaeon]|nr:hypothetical protein [Candidatus Micrarchaeota archaeon]
MKNTILAIPQHNKVYVIKKRALTEMKIGSGRGQAKLWDSFKRCTEGVNSTHDIAAAENKIKKILSFDTPSYEIACKDITFLSKVGMTSIPEGKKNDWNSIVRLMGTFLRKMGYLRNINTHQEERLIGSTVDNAYAKRPFRPIGIVNLELKLHPESARHGLIAVKDARDIQVCGMAFTRMYGLGTH